MNDLHDNLITLLEVQQLDYSKESLENLLGNVAPVSRVLTGVLASGTKNKHRKIVVKYLHRGNIVRKTEDYLLKALNFTSEDVDVVINMLQSAETENLAKAYLKKTLGLQNSVLIPEEEQVLTYFAQASVLNLASRARWKYVYKKEADYTYDELDRLTDVNYLWDSSQNRSFTYDKNGNRLTMNGTIYEYSDSNNHLLGLNGNTTLFSYDANGNLELDGIRGFSYSYDWKNRLSSVFDIVEQIDYDYQYDHMDRRVSKTTPDGTTRYIYSGDYVIAEYDGAGNLKYNYIYPSNAGQAVGQRIARVYPGGAKEYYHNDYLGSARRITNSSGNVLWSRDYYPFGEERTASGVSNKYMFTGKERDLETESDNSWHRQYLYKLGRFSQVDRYWGKYPSISPYVYALNNPLRFTDFTGDTVNIDPTLLDLVLDSEGNLKNVEDMTLEEQQRDFFQQWWGENEDNVNSLFGIGGKYETTNISFKLGYHPRTLFEKLAPKPLYYGRIEWGKHGTNPVNWYNGSISVTPGFGIDQLSFGIYLSPDRARQGTAPHEWNHVYFIFNKIRAGEIVPNAYNQHRIIGFR